MSAHAPITDDPQTVLGGALWAWTGRLTGLDSLTLDGDSGAQRIQLLLDASGHRHHFRNHVIPESWRPGYQVGYAIEASADGGPWRTQHRVIGLDHYADGNAIDGNVFYQRGALNTDGAFYLAAAFANRRLEGAAALWGTSRLDNVILDQGTGQLFLTLGGTIYTITDEGAVPHGPVIVEVWRVNSSGEIVVRVNGATRTAANTSVQGMTSISGWGYDGISPWRDPIFEIVMVDRAIALGEQRKVRQWLAEKWDIPI